MREDARRDTTPEPAPSFLVVDETESFRHACCIADIGIIAAAASLQQCLGHIERVGERSGSGTSKSA